jgi:activator of HSP90 ATPase
MQTGQYEEPGGSAMNGRKNSITPASLTTRRQMIAGVGIAFGGQAASSAVLGKTPQQTMKEKPGIAANRKRTSLHMDIDMKVGPQRIYEVLLDAKQFAAFTGLPAEIDSKVGGAFSLFKGQIEGRNVELIPAQRIVQAWRPSHWDTGIYSIVRFELKPQSEGTTIVLDHAGFPEGDFDHLAWGWHAHYWEPLKKFLA